MTGASVADEQRGTEVARAAAGDEVAFAQLVATHHAYLRRVAMVVCGDAGVAEDAAQQAWQICWRKLRTLRDLESVRPWLASITANEARKLAGRDRRRVVLEATVRPIGDVGSDPGDDVDQIDLARALAHLNSAERELLSLRFVAGLDSTEIARLRGGSAAAVRGRLARLVARLRRELDHD